MVIQFHVDDAQPNELLLECTGVPCIYQGMRVRVTCVSQCVLSANVVAVILTSSFTQTSVQIVSSYVDHCPEVCKWSECSTPRTCRQCPLGKSWVFAQIDSFVAGVDLLLHGDRT